MEKSVLENKIQQIESIIFDKAINMDSPILSEDLSVLVFQATYFHYSGNSLYKKKALELLDRLVEVFPEKELSAGFLEGFEGIFWVITYLKKCGVLESDDMLDELKPHLLRALDLDILTNNFDVFHGSINKLQYMILSKNFPAMVVEEMVEKFVNSLYDNRTETTKGIFWYDIFKNGKGTMVNLGLPHGLPGVLIFLLKLKELGFKSMKITLLIDGLLKSLMSFKNNNYRDSHFPPLFAPDDKGKNFQTTARLAYCYGDLGVVYAFLYASEILNRPDLKQQMKPVIADLNRKILSISKIDIFEEYFFFDTAFCHGLSGITYMFIKINEFNKDPTMAKRIKYWEEVLLHNLDIQLKATHPIKYPEYRQTVKNNTFTIDEQSILGGYSGTGLVLLSLLYHKYDWSEFFLLY